MSGGLPGFVIANALARDLAPAERSRLALVGGLMPSPLVGALVVQGLVDRDEQDLAAGGAGGVLAAPGAAAAPGQPAPPAVPPPGGPPVPDDKLTAAVEAETARDLAAAGRDTALADLAIAATAAVSEWQQQQVAGGSSGGGTASRPSTRKG